jgi:ABC-type amino acid transport substrate-binding protein
MFFQRIPAALIVIFLLAAATPPPAAGAPSSRLQRLLDARELRVCIWPDYYGITYRNPRTRQMSGIDIDIASELGKELGVRVTYVDSSFGMLIDNLLNDRCDIAMHGVGITAARREKLAFTQAYLRSDMYAISTRHGAIKRWDDLDKPGRVIAVQAGTVMEPVMQRYLRHAKLLVVKPPMMRENEVESGRADAFITDFPYSQRMLDMTDWARLVAPTQPFHLTDYAYALAPGDGSLLERVNRFIDTIRQDGRLRQMARRHRLDPILLQDGGVNKTVVRAQ